MSVSRRCLLLLLILLLLNPLSLTQPPAAHAEDGTCIHVDVSITAGGELLTKGPQIANDGGFGHAGTGQTFTFQARTFAPAANICIIQLTDARTWQVSVWPCTNQPKPRPAHNPVPQLVGHPAPRLQDAVLARTAQRHADQR